MTDPYDLVPYPGHAFPHTHPDRLATLATLFGMDPAPADRCRVLELGCGDGGNLIPMAFGLPASRFVGVDRAATAIRKARAAAEALKLENVAFHQLDLRDLFPDFGEFDYIIAHGLYSWAPAEVRDKILSVANSNLAPHGVAYVSYNAYPGGHLRTMVREMMLFHTRDMDDPGQKLSEAQVLLDLLAESVASSDQYGQFLRLEANRLRERAAVFLFHDELGPIYQPVYFHQFHDHAARHGLQYLCEASFSDMWVSGLPTAASAVLDRFAGDIVRREQYLDFLKCRSFRKTLLCHKDVPLDRGLKPQVTAKFHIASRARPVSAEPDLRPGIAEEFRGPAGSAATTAHPLAKAALFHLTEVWPESLSFSALLERAPSGQHDAFALGEILLRTYAAGLVEFHLHPPCCVREPGERPIASPVARLQVREQERIPNLLHSMIHVTGSLERQLILLLDGSRDRAALMRDLTAFLRAEQPDGEARPGITPEQLERSLAALARLGLLLR